MLQVSPITKKGGSVILNIDNVIGNQNLKYDTSYSIASGEKYTIKKLKYYISNIQFMKGDGSVTTLQQAIANGNMLSWSIENLNFHKLHLGIHIHYERGHKTNIKTLYDIS